MVDNTDGQTLTGNTPAIDAPNSAVGRVVLDATALTATEFQRVLCGFRPKYVCWEDVSDGLKFEWYEGMADDSCIKTVAAGDRTIEVTGGNGGITVDAKGFRVLQNATLIAVVASNNHTWRAHS